MKRQILAVAALGCLCLLGGGVAQVQSMISVKVPFQFVVADHTFPGGEYLMSSIGDKVLVQNSQGKTVAIVLSNAVSGRSVETMGQVVFQCYDRLCFLSELWIPTEYAGRRLMKSRWETEVGRQQAPVYFALAGRKTK